MTDQPPSNTQAAKLFRRTPEIEVAIGARLKMLRLAAHMSQTTLGEAIGVSFQQIQKYEKGSNRRWASTPDPSSRAKCRHRSAAAPTLEPHSRVQRACNGSPIPASGSASPR